MALEGIDYVLCQSGERSRVAFVLDRLVESVEKHFVGGVGGVGLINIRLHDGDAAARDGRRYHVVGRRVHSRRPRRRVRAVHAGAIAHPLLTTSLNEDTNPIPDNWDRVMTHERA